MVFVWMGIRKNIISYYSPHSQLIHNHDAEVYVTIASCFIVIANILCLEPSFTDSVFRLRIPDSSF